MPPFVTASRRASGRARTIARRAVPDDPRPQLGELLGRVAAGQHVEDALELGPGEVAVGIRLRGQLVQLVHRPVVERGRGHELLGEHVERLAGHAGVLDLAAAHAVDDDRRLQQVAAVLGHEAAERGHVHLVAGPADALQPGGDRLRRLDLHDQVDRAHVDPELERRGGDERRQPARLEHVLDLEPLLAGDRAVVGAGDVGARELVEAMGDALGRAAVVHEDERRPVGLDELEQARVERRPDRLARLAVDVGRAAQLAHVLDGDDHLEVELLGRAGVDDLDVAVAPAEEAGDLLQRPLGRREADPLHVAAGQVLEPLERERQVGAPLAAGHRVDLVDDHRLGRGQHLPGGRGQDQVERLGRRDQDVGRVAAHRRAVALGRVAAADGHGHRPGQVDAGERRAQVLLDVVVERLERRHVDHAGAALRRVAGEAVDRAQEGGQRLARSRRREDQRVAPGGDRRPAQPLRLRGLGKRPPEPGGDGGRERGQRVGRHGRLSVEGGRGGWPGCVVLSGHASWRAQHVPLGAHACATWLTPRHLARTACATWRAPMCHLAVRRRRHLARTACATWRARTAPLGAHSMCHLACAGRATGGRRRSRVAVIHVRPAAAPVWPPATATAAYVTA